LATLLLFPAGLALVPWYTQEQLFYGVPKADGPFQFIARQIYTEKAPIDVLFVGSSLTWAGIDSEMIESKLRSEHNKSNARVLNFGVLGRADELIYLLLSEVLKQRRVKLVVYESPRTMHDANGPYYHAHRWLNPFTHFEAVRDINPKHLLSYYALSVLGAPRSFVVTLLPPGRDLAQKSEHSYWVRPDNGGPTLDMPQNTPIFGVDDALRSKTVAGEWRQSPEPLTPFQKFWFEKTRKLVEAHGVTLVTLNIPIRSDLQAGFITEKIDPDLTKTHPLTQIGLVPGKLYLGTADPERRFFTDDHMQREGARYFSGALVPVLALLLGSFTGEN
jgi:hypothetical protein